MSRYDQTLYAGPNACVGPAFYDTGNPDYLHDVGWATDDHALIADGGSRDLGDGVASVSRNPDGSYAVSLKDWRIAVCESWCERIWSATEYDTGCTFDVPR